MMIEVDKIHPFVVQKGTHVSKDGRTVFLPLSMFSDEQLSELCHEFRETVFKLAREKICEK